MTNYIFSDLVPYLLSNFAVVSSGHKLRLLDLVCLCEHGKAEESPDSISINYIGFKFTFFNHRNKVREKKPKKSCIPNNRFICSSFSSTCRLLPASHQYHNRCQEWSSLTNCIGYCTLWPAIEFSLKLGALLISFPLIVPKLEVNYIYDIVIKFLLEVFHYCA